MNFLVRIVQVLEASVEAILKVQQKALGCGRKGFAGRPKPSMTARREFVIIRHCCCPELRLSPRTFVLHHPWSRSTIYSLYEYIREEGQGEVCVHNQHNICVLCHHAKGIAAHPRNRNLRAASNPMWSILWTTAAIFLNFALILTKACSLFM